MGESKFWIIFEDVTAIGTFPSAESAQAYIDKARIGGGSYITSQEPDEDKIICWWDSNQSED